jgi:putative hydroxymethylpyrimidine transport system ATP-binding protein
VSAPAITITGRYLLDGAPLFGPLDLTLPAGRWTCLLGPSGAGKTTLLQVLAGLKVAGQFEGQITTSDSLPIDGRAGLMAQTDLLLPWLTTLENTVLGARLRGDTPDLDAAKQMLTQVGLGDHIHKKPAALSGGMRQRAALARTLMEQREVVFLDEPFSALDASTRAAMQELAAQTLVDQTVLLITHDPAEALRLGHQIIVLTPSGAKSWPVPDEHTPRDLYAPDMLSHQADLMRYLRGL